jgi:hypothetical protein
MMLMGPPPHIIACGREHRPHACCEGLTPVQVSMVVQARVACDAEGQATVAAPLEAVQKIAPAQRPSIVLQGTHVPSGARRAYSPAPWVTVRWSSSAWVQWSMLDASVQHCAPTCPCAVRMGFMVPERARRAPASWPRAYEARAAIVPSIDVAQGQQEQRVAGTSDHAVVKHAGCVLRHAAPAVIST